jgi:hypothetical protein
MYETRPVLVEEMTETTPTYPSTLTVPPVPSSFDPHGGNTKCHEVAVAVAPNFTYSLDVPWFATKNDFRYSEAANMETADADKTVTPPLAGEVIVLAPVTALTFII